MNREKTPWMVVAIAISALTACGGVVDGATTSGPGGTTGTGGGATGSGGGTSSSSGSGGGACAGFADEEGTAATTVRFRNDTGVPLYLPVTCSSVDYTITPDGGSDGVSYVFDASCLQTCEALQEAPPYVCGACQTITYRILPGQTRDVVWKGTGLLSSVQMPAACWAEPSAIGACSRILAAKAGGYRIQAVGYDACEGECTCNADGECVGTAAGSNASVAPVPFDFPADGMVEVVFDPCAFGCPGG